MQVTSADSCRTRKTEDVETVDLVCVSGLLRIGGDSFLFPVWRSVGRGSLAEGSWMCG